MVNRQPQNYVYQNNPDPRYCKKCRYCRQLIDKKASICPFCGKSQPLIPPLACFAILAAIFGMFLFFYEPADNSNVNVVQENAEYSETVATEKATTSKDAALESAKIEIICLSYSYSGLIEQLELNGYTHEDSVYAADNCGANWNEEALETAKIYGFSNQQDTIDVLKKSGFTDEQINYAVSKLQ